MALKEESKPTKRGFMTPHVLRRLPATFSLVAVGIIFIIISGRLTIVPGWLLLSIIIAATVAIFISFENEYHKLGKWLSLGVQALSTLFFISSVGLLIATLPESRNAPIALFRDALLLWVCNVLIFSVWYWELDRGGPVARHSKQPGTIEFLFPQMTQDRLEWRDWMPLFVDYLFLAFNTSTAFSPTDTAVLSRRFKLITMLQSSLSLIIISVLAARAVNIL